MSDKIVIILGGSGQIGSSIAQSLSGNYKPFLIGRNSDRLKKISSHLLCNYSEGDINDMESIEKCFKKIDGKICGFAYCIGSIDLKSIFNASKKDFLESYNINLIGAIESLKLILSQLIINKGSILFFSTVAAKKGFINHSIISSSKGAIEGLTVSLAAELSPKVRVNCISPSLVNSGMSKRIISNPKIEEGIAKKHPIPRIGQGSDFGPLGAMLLTDKSSWITGQIFNIDGGRSTISK